MKQAISILTITLVIFVPALSIAKDFGQYGLVFEIKEEGFIAMIQRKLKLIDIKSEEKKMLEIAKKKVEEPASIANIKRTVKPATFTYDPSYILPDDIILPNGKLFYAKGARVNPLDHMTLDKKLIFIDGRDQEQVEWFKNKKAAGDFNQQDKLILVAGRPIDLGNNLRQEVYFDQGGFLTTKFNIEQVPAIIEQEGKVLRIKELEVEAQSNKLATR
jgi:conjugal transfer pilus assembly protein TraW